MHQPRPWWREDSPAAARHSGPSPALLLSSVILLIIYICFFKDLAQENPVPPFAQFPYYRCLLRKKCLKTPYSYSCLSCVCLQCGGVSGAGPAPAAARGAPAPPTHPWQRRRGFSLSKCVQCGMQAYRSALSGFWGQVISKLGFCLLCSTHPGTLQGVGTPCSGPCCFFIAPALLSSSWLSSQSFYSGEILLCGSV